MDLKFFFRKMKMYLYLAEDTSGVHPAGLVHCIAPDIEHRLRGSDNTAHCSQPRRINKYNIFKQGDFLRFFFLCTVYSILLHLPPDSFVSEDAGIEPRTVATSALAARRSNHSARSHPQSARSHPLLG
jgi:hypothetical protein